MSWCIPIGLLILDFGLFCFSPIRLSLSGPRNGYCKILICSSCSLVMAGIGIADNPGSLNIAEANRRARKAPKNQWSSAVCMVLAACSCKAGSGSIHSSICLVLLSRHAVLQRAASRRYETQDTGLTAKSDFGAGGTFRAMILVTVHPKSYRIVCCITPDSTFPVSKKYAACDEFSHYVTGEA